MKFSHAIIASAGLVSLVAFVVAQPQADQPGAGSANRPSQQVNRPGSVNLEAEYDLSNLKIPRDEIHTLLPRDAIPALTDPKLESPSAAAWLADDARIISVAVGGRAVAVPLTILDWHEVVNLSIAGEPVAVTYCPLCDSAAVFSRRVPATGGEGQGAGEQVLEFGVSGALYNSNVLMYDRTTKGLWSQLGMQAVSGPLAGVSLDALPVEIMSFDDFKAAQPKGQVVSKETGHRRAYGSSPYKGYMSSPDLMVPVAGAGDALPRKTLGLGVAVGDRAWFIPKEAIGKGYELQTPAGPVRAEATDAGVRVLDAPKEAKTAQSFYYAWSAFYPETEVIQAGADAGRTEAPDAEPAAPGLAIGSQAPDADLLTPTGEPVSLSDFVGERPTVLLFYRGGWCPICTRSLAGWHEKLDELQATGARLVAIAPEKPSHAADTVAKGDLGFTVLSDPELQAARAFNLVFTVDEKTQQQYQRMFDLDLTEWNGSGTPELPAPGTFVIDANGIIRFAHADWDYRVRADPDDVIAAVRGLAAAPSLQPAGAP